MPKMSVIVKGVLVSAVVSVILGNGAQMFSVIVGGLERYPTGVSPDFSRIQLLLCRI